MSGYDQISNGSAYTQAMAGFFSRSKSAQQDNAARQELVSRSRVLYLESAMARSCVDVLLRECIGNGLRYSPKDTSDYFQNYAAITSELNTELKKASDLHTLDSTARLTFPQIQSLVFRTILLSGDCFIIRLDNGSFCIKESDYVFTPDFLTVNGGREAKYEGNSVFDGVEVDGLGIPVAYWFCNTLYKEDLKNRDRWVRIPAIDAESGLPRVLHCAYFERPQQYRGLPLVSPVIEDLWSLRAYLTSETQMAITQVNQSWVITTQTNPTLNPFVGLTEQDLDAPLVSNGAAPKREPSKDFSINPPSNSAFNGELTKTKFIQPGSSLHLAEGEDIKAIAPTAPHSGLETFIKCVTDQIGSAVGIPSQILTARIDSNFSSCKAAFAQLQHTVRLYRGMFTETFLKPFFQCFVYETMQAKGWHSKKYSDYESSLIIANEAIWKPSTPAVMLEPNKEMQFYRDALDLGLISRDEVSQLLFGHDAVKDEVDTEIKLEDELSNK